jgi:predicted nucleotidyltransferase
MLMVMRRGRNPMFQNLDDLIARLESNPRVVGIVRYGSRRPTDLSLGGDFDLFVFVKERPPDIESIHFYVGDIPVELYEIIFQQGETL